MSEPQDTYRRMTRRHDPSTSHAAAASWTPGQLSDVQQRIGELLKAVLPDGLTHEEQHDRYWAEWPTAESSPRKRCKDLERMGLVVDSGEKRKLRSGRMGIVWKWVGWVGRLKRLSPDPPKVAKKMPPPPSLPAPVIQPRKKR
jgi:hypothetical protein